MGLNVACWRHGTSWLVTRWRWCWSSGDSLSGPRAQRWGGVACAPCHAHAGDGRRQNEVNCVRISPNAKNARKDGIVQGPSGKWCQPICMVGFAWWKRKKWSQRNSRKNHLEWTLPSTFPAILACSPCFRSLATLLFDSPSPSTCHFPLFSLIPVFGFSWFNCVVSGMGGISLIGCVLWF